MSITIPVAARPQKDILVKIGEKEYQRHCSNVSWTPSPTTVTWQGGEQDATLTDTVEGAWVAALTMVQDWENSESLVNLMLANPGEKVEIEFKPHADGEFKIVSTITLVSPTIGGPVNAYNESTVSCSSSVPVPTFPLTAEARAAVQSDPET